MINFLPATSSCSVEEGDSNCLNLPLKFTSERLGSGNKAS